MNLTRKVLVRLSLTLGVVLLVSITLSYSLILKTFLTIEHENLNTNTLRAKNALENIINNTSIKLADWSKWDDTYNFVKSHSQEYIDSNLYPDSPLNLKLNSLLIFDGSSKLISGVYVDLKSQKSLPIPDYILDFFTKTNPETIKFVNQNDKHAGIFLHDGLPIIFAANPVTDSLGAAKPNGTIVFTRNVDADLIQEINELSQNKVEFSTDLSVWNNTKQDLIISTINANTQKSFTQIKDFNDHPILTMTITRDRPIYTSALKTLSFFTFIIALSFIAIIIVNHRIIKTTILDPLATMIRQVSQITVQQNFTYRLPEFSGNEFALLSQTLNSMFEKLDQSKSTLEEKISFAEKTNRAMINILEDERDLENKLKTQHDKSQILINSMGEGLLVIDTGYKITTINPVAEKLLETTAAKAIGKNWSEFVKTTKGDSVTPLEERTFAQVLQSGSTIITALDDDHYYLTPSGKKFPITSITAPIIDNEKIVGAIKVFRDATPEKEEKGIIEETVKKRTQELHEEKARLTASINNLPVGFILTDILGNILISNPNASNILNLSPFPATITELQTHLESTLQTDLENCFQNKSPVEVKDQVYNTQVLHLFISPIVVPTDIQNCIGAVILIQDITEAKVLERSREEFFSIASHELRTPLTAIRGNTSMILQYFKDRLEGNVLDMIKDIESASIRLISIVNDFLDVSRLEQGRIEFKKSNFDPIDLIKHVIEEFQASSSQQKVLVQLDLSTTENIPPVFADPDRTHQVLMNLIGNAMKFTENGDITIALSKKDRFIEITVTDTGRGIPLENQKLLFHKFQQAGNSLYTRDTTKGTGLGLYISKLIVEGQGGKIYLIKSSLETGSTFGFTLPIFQN